MPAAANSEAMRVVFVHGAWADGSGWEGVYRLLRKEDFSVSVVQVSRQPVVRIRSDGTRRPP